MPAEHSPADRYPMRRATDRSAGYDRWHPLADGIPPALGERVGPGSLVGVFVAFTIVDVTQRLRWISPGRFRMGSPETEAERDEAGPAA